MAVMHNVALGIAVVASIVTIISISTMMQPAPAQFPRPDENQSGTLPTNRTFYINTVNHEASANVTEEPFPNSTLPAGGGYELNPPDEQGDWRIETYVFDPSQIVVYEGDQVTLNILGVRGGVHNISVSGYVDEFELHRGELRTLTFTADRAGTIDFICSIHQPTMHGQILVLPRG
jgi:Cupredoxin-like domain